MQQSVNMSGQAMKGQLKSCRVIPFRPINTAVHKVADVYFSSAGPSSSVPSRSVTSQAAGKGFGTPKAPAGKASPPVYLDPCPCGSGKAYKNCCKSALEGTKPAATLEAAIRARFGAYISGGEASEAYIFKTTHPSYADFHYLKPWEEVKDKLVEDIHTACTKFDFMELKIQKSELEEGNTEIGSIAFSYKSGEKGSDTEVSGGLPCHAVHACI
jgi:uncharacterized protein YchJ